MDLLAKAPQSPEKIFPLEVWALILDNLGSATDLKNCNLTCKAWKTLLLRKRTTFLMPKVFPIVYKYLLVEDENETVAPENYYSNEEENENIRARLMRKSNEVLKMRLISTSWKEAVDTYYQNHYVFNDINFVEKFIEQRDFEVNRDFPLCPYHFDKDKVSKLESFLDKDFPSESNPFITRYLNFNDNVFSRDTLLKRQFRNNFKKLLRSFGSHIWNCVLTLTCSTQLTEQYQLLWSYLSLMPNLRSLDIFLADIYDERKVVRSTRFEKLLKKQPFPKLEHIVRLYLAGVPYPISVGILAQNEHVQNLSIHGYYKAGALPDPVVELKTLKLEQLVLFSVFQDKDLLQLQKLNWPQKAFHLFLQSRIRWENLFQAVSPFKDSLEHLVLTLNNWQWRGQRYLGLGRLKDLRLELPNLKKFKLEVPLKIATIDFLAECTALQEIELWIDNDNLMKEADDLPREGDVEVIQFESCITAMHKSNVWNILPALQLLKIDTTGYHRHFPYKTHPDARFTRRQHEKYAESLMGAAQ